MSHGQAFGVTSQEKSRNAEQTGFRGQLDGGLAPRSGSLGGERRDVGQRLFVQGDACAELERVGCETLVLDDGRGKVDLAALIEALGRRDVNELHVEAGHKLNGSFVRERLVDELLFYLAPSLLGPGRPMIALPAITELASRVALTFDEVVRIGDDLRIRARVLPIASSEG